MTRFAIIALVLALASSAGAETITGTPRIKDGDSIVIDGREIRLDGIDAPEMAQTCTRGDNGQPYRCGLVARGVLVRMARGRPISCDVLGTDRYQRALAVCTDGEIEVNAEMVRAGWALAFRRYSERYVPEEDEARAARRGLWRGGFEPPWDWRAAHPREHR